MGIALLALLYALHGVGYARRTIFLALMVAVWGLRLSLFLLFTRATREPEDGRYLELRRKWGSNIGLKFLLFFEFRALLCGVLSFPFLVAMHDPLKGWSEFEEVGAAIWFVALIGEIMADAQLVRFKRRNPGRVCDVGLWRYSRHPNYFFEFLIWVSFAIIALPVQYGYLALISPVLILFLLLRVSGTEEQAIRSKGQAYRKYQRSTSPFIPWFPNFR
jgi:steroid 5-alpha reductase family enzyme